MRPRTCCVIRSIALVCGLLLFASSIVADERTRRRFPDIVIVTVDTLRVDRVSAYGYHKPTTPHIDSLLAGGVRFTQARVPEPLTAPSLSSMLTSLYPHEHGASRNGLLLRPGLPSLGTILARRSYKTAAFVGNWTLRDELSGLGEHFQSYNEIFTRKRWMVFAGEATADDLTEEALDWLDSHLKAEQRWPFLLWVHYVEPHAPYRFHKEFAERLGIQDNGEVSPSDRYDTEVAFVDRAIGELLDGLGKRLLDKNTMVVFASDHGESLGEHDYWGHGRHLYDRTLHIPFGIHWPGKIKAQEVVAPASLLDVPPTIFGMVGLPVPDATMRGYDWSSVLQGQAQPPQDRVTYHEAHKGAVQRQGNKSARRQGLLEVARIENGEKEILRVRNGNRRVFDLVKDPAEEHSKVALKSKHSKDLERWLTQVREGLIASDELPPPVLNEENLEQLRALGYID